MPINIQTISFSKDHFNIDEEEQEFFVFALGYEDRSAFIINKLLQNTIHHGLTPIFFLFNDYIPSDPTLNIVEQLATNQIHPVKVSYNDYDKVLETLAELIRSRSTKKIRFHIDYSSMPRSWYCRFPIFLNEYPECISKLYFWYAVGDYETNSEGFPSAGVRDIRLFSGRATLRPINNRTHIFGLGFDHVRTQGIMSVLDPSYYGVCYAYPYSDNIMLERVKSENKEILNSSAFSFELPLHDFQFMMAKLVDLSNNLIDKGDVIFIPDGPKPLILACSLAPTIVTRKGVVCLHVIRHDEYYEPINVKAKGDILGFSYESSSFSTDDI